MAMNPSIIREPVMLHFPPIHLKTTFTGELTVAEHISNRIWKDFKIEEAEVEAKRLGVYDGFLEARHLCHEIEKQIQARHKLHFPLLPSITCEVEGNFYRIKAIEYIRHDPSGVMIAKLKIELV